MVDLKFSYTKQDGTRVTEEFDTIMDFTDSVETGNYSASILNAKDVEAKFFENPLLDQHFEKVEDLYYHCTNIMTAH